MMEIDEGHKVSGADGDTLKRRAISLSSSELDQDTETVAASEKQTNNISKLAGQSSKVDESKEESRKRVRTTRGSPNEADEAGSESPVIPEKLEVPSKELQCIQKQVLIEKLMGTTTTAITHPCTTLEEDDESMDIQPVSTKKVSNKNHSKKLRAPTKPPTLSHEDFKRTFKMRSSLLDRVKTFLPELKTSNEELLRLPDPSKISLESDMDETDGAVAGPSSGISGDKMEELTTTGENDNKPYVEMKFALLQQSDSDTSSDDEGLGRSPSVLPEQIKGLPALVSRKDRFVSLVSSDVTTSNTISAKESAPLVKDANIVCSKSETTE